jgi:cell division septation protein DedD
MQILNNLKMKKIFLAICIIILVAGTMNSAYAQMSNKESKEWKKRKSKMSMNEFKAMFEENSALRGQVNSMKGQVSTLQSRISDKDAKIAELTGEARKFEQMATAAQQPQVQNTPVRNTEYDRGVVFRVQVGAFKNKDLSNYFQNNDNFGGETDENGVQKITIGVFRDYWEADVFKKHLRQIGVKDAWIVPFKDGTRVPMKDVLEGVI